MNMNRQIILIVGKNRAEFCRPKPKDVDVKHFFVTRNQLYKVYPDMYVKCRWYWCDVEVGTDEFVVYPENGIRPHIQAGAYTNFDKLMMDIDEHKMSANGIHKKPFGMLSSKTVSHLKDLLPFIILGAVLAYAFLSNGGL